MTSCENPLLYGEHEICSVTCCLMLESSQRKPRLDIRRNRRGGSTSRIQRPGSLFSLANFSTTTYQLDNDPIASQNFCKDLGNMFSTDLSWSQHYQKITSHAYRQLGLIRRCFSPSIPVEVKKVLYTALVRSHLTYCSEVWRPRYINDSTTLERV